MTITKAFISYSHDSPEHKKWVLDLATRLRNTGIDAIIDLWELKPGDDLAVFMEKNLAASDYVLMICTDRYVEKANLGIGGVGYEKMIITSDLIKNIDSNKVIPIIKQNGTHNVPTFLKTKKFIDFSGHGNFEFNYDELARTLHNSPLYVKPEIGNSPFTPVENIQPEKTGDPLKQVMTDIINRFERGDNYFSYIEILKSVGISRIYFELIIKDAFAQGLLKIHNENYCALTSKGKSYAIEHNIVKT